MSAPAWIPLDNRRADSPPVVLFEGIGDRVVLTGMASVVVEKCVPDATGTPSWQRVTDPLEHAVTLQMATLILAARFFEFKEKSA